MWQAGTGNTPLDHVMVAIFNSSDKRSHTILVIRRNEKEERGSMLDRMEGTMRDVGAKKIEKGTLIFLRRLGVKLGQKIGLPY
jgi:hypothetical protein